MCLFGWKLDTCTELQTSSAEHGTENLKCVWNEAALYTTYKEACFETWSCGSCIFYFYYLNRLSLSLKFNNTMKIPSKTTVYGTRSGVFYTLFPKLLFVSKCCRLLFCNWLPCDRCTEMFFLLDSWSCRALYRIIQKSFSFCLLQTS